MKVHGRDATKGIKRIDAGLGGHDQGAGGMGAVRTRRHDLAGGGWQAQMLNTAPFKGVGGRDSRRRELEEAWAGALRGLERRRRRIDLW